MTTITDSDTLEAAVVAATWADGNGRPQGSTVELPPGEIVLQRPVKIRNVRHLRIAGDNTWLVYDGPATRSVVEFEAAHSCEVAGVSVVMTGRLGLAQSAVRMKSPDSTTGLTWITSLNRLTDFRCPHTGSPNAFVYGVHLENPARDANNDFHTLTRCVFSNYTHSGVCIQGGQIHQILFDGCRFVDDAARAQFGVNGHYGNFWEARNCFFGNHSDCDVFVREFSHRAVVSGCNSEGSRRLLRTGGNPAQITIRDTRWAGKPQAGDYAIQNSGRWSNLVLSGLELASMDGQACRVYSAGPLRIDDCQLKQFGGVYPPVGTEVTTLGNMPIRGSNNVYTLVSDAGTTDPRFIAL